jgi:hypothetical protein
MGSGPRVLKLGRSPGGASGRHSGAAIDFGHASEVCKNAVLRRMRLDFPGHGGILPRLWGADSNCRPSSAAGKTNRAPSIPSPGPPGHIASSGRFVPRNVEERLDGHLPDRAAGACRDALQHGNRCSGHVCGFFRCAHFCQRPMDVDLLGWVHRLGSTGGTGLAILLRVSKLPDEWKGGKSLRAALDGAAGARHRVCGC